MSSQNNSQVSSEAGEKKTKNSFIAPYVGGKKLQNNDPCLIAYKPLPVWLGDEVAELNDEEKNFVLNDLVAIHVFGCPESWVKSNCHMTLPNFGGDAAAAGLVLRRMHGACIRGEVGLKPDAFNVELVQSLKKWVGPDGANNEDLNAVLLALSPAEISHAALRALGVSLGGF